MKEKLILEMGNHEGKAVPSTSLIDGAVVLGLLCKYDPKQQALQLLLDQHWVDSLPEQIKLIKNNILKGLKDVPLDEKELSKLITAAELVLRLEEYLEVYRKAVQSPDSWIQILRTK